jgi:hypothetical protein
MDTSKISLLSADTVELHYWFNDKSHTMDAVVQNKCEKELLSIINEVAKQFDIEIDILTEPLANGGIRRWFKLFLKNKNAKVSFYTALITAFATCALFTPIGTTLSEIGKQVIEQLFNDDERAELEKEILKENIENTQEDTNLKILEQAKLKEEIQNLKLDAEIKMRKIEQNTVIPKRKSNFYSTLQQYKKIDKISIITENDSKDTVHTITIDRTVFNDYILTSDDLPAIQNEHAIIEIISPVLKKGDYKWKGIYNGEILNFNMKSNEFKTLVQTGKIEFKNGTSIDCLLEIERKIDNEGHEIPVGLNIIRVNNYFVNDTPIETPEGKRHRQKEEADKSQLNLNFEEYDK